MRHIILLISSIFLFFCSCNGGGGGSFEPCKGVTCSGHGECQVIGGSAVCVCEDNYVALGLSCIPADSGVEVEEDEGYEDIVIENDQEDMNTEDENGEVPQDNFYRSLAIGDVNNDGYNELVLGDVLGKMVVVYKINTDGSEQELNRLFFNESPQSLAIGDVDNDTYNELIVGTSNSDDGGYVYVGSLSGVNFEQNWVSPIIKSFRWSKELSIGDSDMDGFKEIAVGVSWYGRYLIVYEWNGVGFDLKFLDRIGSDVDSVLFCNLDQDANDELLVGTACWNDYSTRVYDNVEDSLSLVFHQSGGITDVAAGDVNGDGLFEIISFQGTRCGVAGKGLIIVYDSYFNLISSKEVISGNDFRLSGDVGDLDNDGKDDIVSVEWFSNIENGSLSLRVFSFSNGTLNELFSTSSNSNFDGIKIGDVDNDGTNEIVAVTGGKYQIINIGK